MNNFVTIHTFTFPSDLIAIRGRLEAEGIECQTKDELTVQVHNFYSNAIGGIRLQVKQKDYEKAKEILIENGYIQENEKESDFWEKINKRTKNIPLFNKIRVELRFITLIGTGLFILLFAVFGILSNINKKPPPSTYDYLTNNSWCLNHIEYDGKKYVPKTISNDKIRIVISGHCEETLDFVRNGHIFIPGFNTKLISGKWKLIEDNLVFTELDTLSDIFTATYKVKKEPNKLTLESKNISIHCYNEFY